MTYQARTFPAMIPFSVLSWDERSVNTTERRNNEDEDSYPAAAQYHRRIHRVGLLFQNVLAHVPGYLTTTVADVQLDNDHVTIVHLFSTLYPITEEDVWRELTISPLLCPKPHSSCVSPLTSDVYQGLSLCDFDMCDSSSSDCHSHGGLVTCECHRGYYKFDPTERSCKACGSGFQQTENGCERCSLGFGGFNCEEPYLLVVIVESCVGIILLASLITLLFFYFRRKKPPKSMFIDSVALGVPTDQPSLRLPRAQFSWRREWEWNEPPGKVFTDIHREAASPGEPAIHMKTFGDPARFSAPNSYHGRHNLSFISDD
ncbi:protein HEG-like [Rhinoderma darwinii]|uniref:protein HEG-like n=1 Tax=Rhinoderma darwinii TaxID=43563 RepID=UPI003F662BFD